MYDITHDRTLQRVARLMEQQGYERVNYSVWYGLRNPSENLVLKEKLKTWLTAEVAKGSRMYFLPIKTKDMEKMRTYDGKPIEQMDYWLGRINTAFF